MYIFKKRYIDYKFEAYSMINLIHHLYNDI